MPERYAGRKARCRKCNCVLTIPFRSYEDDTADSGIYAGTFAAAGVFGGVMTAVSNKKKPSAPAAPIRRIGLRTSSALDAMAAQSLVADRVDVPAAQSVAMPVYKESRCPRCGAGNPEEGEPCLQCGFQARIHGQGRVAPTPAACSSVISMSAIFQLMFNTDMRAHAINIVGKQFMWWIKLFAVSLVASLLILPFAIGDIRAVGFAQFIVSIYAVVSGVRLWSWVVGKYFSIVSQYERGDAWGEEPSHELKNLGIWLAILVMTFSPMLLGAIHAGLLAIALIAGALYWPMAVAVAGAYQTINPVRVIQEIGRCLGGYMLVLVYQLPFVCFVCLAATAVLDIAVAGMRVAGIGHPLLVFLVASAVFACFVQYTAVTFYAMLGMLLRKYRQGNSLSWDDVASSFLGIGAAVTADIILAIVVILIQHQCGNWLITTLSRASVS